MRRRALLAVAGMAAILVACGNRVSTDPTLVAADVETAVRATLTAAEASKPTAEPPTATEVLATVAATEPTATIEPPTSTNVPLTVTPATEDLVLVKQTILTRDKQLLVGFLVYNPNNVAAEHVPFQVNGYDEDGNVLKTESGVIALVAPDETVGTFMLVNLPDEPMPTTTELKLSQPQEWKTANYWQAFTVDKLAFLEGDDNSRVTAIIGNPHRGQFVTNLRVDVLGFDRAGEFVGGGGTFVDAIKPDSTEPVEVGLDIIEVPVTIEMYVNLSTRSQFGQLN